MKLEPDCVVAEPTARQPHPFDRRLARLDPLFRRAAPVVARHDALGGTPPAGDNDAAAGLELARMPFDFGNPMAFVVPRSGLIPESGVGAAGKTGKSARREK